MLLMLLPETQIWNYNVKAASSSPAVVNGVVYMGAYPCLYAFNATTGAVLWDYASTAAGISSPTVVNGVVYIGAGEQPLPYSSAMSEAMFML